MPTEQIKTADEYVKELDEYVKVVDSYINSQIDADKIDDFDAKVQCEEILVESF